MLSIYNLDGEDITMIVLTQIRMVADIIKEKRHVSFEEALGQFYRSKVYVALQNTATGLWGESAEFIADRFFEDKL